MDGEAKNVRIDYPGGVSVLVPVGTTVLAASRAGAIDHSSVCGGRGRCSSCRVRVLSSAQPLPIPDKAEQALLQNLPHWSSDIRLACRLRAQADLVVEPLISPHTDGLSPEVTGRMMSITVMFVDIRGFSRMSARMHPFDVVFMLNRFYDLVGTAVTEAGGMVDKFIGDGVMALFGVDNDHEDGAHQALKASRDLARSLHVLNAELQAELTEPLKIGIGLHSGPAIVGRFGWGKHAVGEITAIGDMVNVASRLEAATKALACQLVMSETVAQALGAGRLRYPDSNTELPNYDGRIQIRAVLDACGLEL